MFDARIRANHKRKSSFWAHVNGERKMDKDVVEDANDQEDQEGGIHGCMDREIDREREAGRYIDRERERERCIYTV